MVLREVPMRAVFSFAVQQFAHKGSGDSSCSRQVFSDKAQAVGFRKVGVKGDHRDISFGQAADTLMDAGIIDAADSECVNRFFFQIGQGGKQRLRISRVIVVIVSGKAGGLIQPQLFLHALPNFLEIIVIGRRKTDNGQLSGAGFSGRRDGAGCQIVIFC